MFFYFIGPYPLFSYFNIFGCINDLFYSGAEVTAPESLPNTSLYLFAFPYCHDSAR